MATLYRGLPINYEPKTTNRFFVNFPNELNLQQFQVQSFKAPSYEVEHDTVGFFNGYDYTATKFKWNPIDISFVDIIGPSTSGTIMEWVRLSMESLTGRMGYAIGYKKDIELLVCDPTGLPISSWICTECMIIDGEFGEHSYDEGEVLRPKMTIQPKYCEMQY